jgi:hypothetical protein
MKPKVHLSQKIFFEEFKCAEQFELGLFSLRKMSYCVHITYFSHRGTVFSFSLNYRFLFLSPIAFLSETMLKQSAIKQEEEFL